MFRTPLLPDLRPEVALHRNEMAIGVREVAACSDTHSTVFLGHSAECANP